MSEAAADELRGAPRPPIIDALIGILPLQPPGL
jgi:hypothetical protein